MMYRFKIISLFFFLTIGSGCNQSYQLDNVKIYLADELPKNNQIDSTSWTPLPENKDTILSEDQYFIKEFTTKSPFYIRSDSKVTYQLYENNKFVFERDTSDFYFEKLHDDEDKIGYRTYDGDYLKRIVPKKHTNYKIIYRSLEIENKLSELTLPTKVKEIAIFNQEKVQLPILRLNLNEPLSNKGEKSKVDISFETNELQHAFQTKIAIRGHTSRGFPKKQFKIKPPQEIQLDTTIFSPKMTIYGPYVDKSYIRNALSFSLARKIGLLASRTYFCHLVINQNYEGLYLLMDKPIPPKEGQLLKIDRDGDFKVEQFNSSIKYQTIPADSENIVKTKVWVEKMNNAHKLGDLEELIDVNSFIDFIIIHELTRNVDSYRNSVYLTKMNNSNVFQAGPLWDFNLSFGNAKINDGYKTEGFVFNYEETKKNIPIWWFNLIENPTFYKALQIRYSSLRKDMFADEKIIESIDSVLNDMKGEEKFNELRWNFIESKEDWVNHYLPDSYEEEIERLKSWTLKRLNWLDTQWLAEGL